MREILFRGQTRKHGEKVRMGDGQKLPGHWVYGGVLQGIGDHSIIYGGDKIEDTSEGFDKWCVHTDTLGQFTGLVDKNGKMIFEGDILSTENGTFSNTGMGHILLYKGMWTSFYGQDAIGRDCFDELHTVCGSREVIGNIYDNPELLEV